MSNATLSNRTSFQEFRRALRAGRGLIIGCVAVSALLGLALNAWTPPIYRASTRLEIRRPIEPTPLAAGGFQSENVALYTTAELITNRGLLEQLNDDFARRNWLDPEVWGDPLRTNVRALARAAGFSGDVAARAVDPVNDPRETTDARVDWLSTIIHVQPVQDTRLVDIKVDHPDPVAARCIADRLAERFVDYAAARVGAVAPAVPGEPDAPARAASVQAAADPLPPRDDSASVTAVIRQLEARVTELTDELVRTEADDAAARTRLARCVRWDPDSISDGADMPLQGGSLGTLRDELLNSRMRLAAARQVYGERHPRLLALEAEQAELRRSLERERSHVIAEARADHDALTARAEALRADLARTEQALADRARILPTLAGASGPARPPIEIVDRAALLPEPVRPRRALNLVACLSAGGLIGCGLAGVRHGSRRTIRTAEDAEEDLQLPVLAVLPGTH